MTSEVNTSFLRDEYSRKGLFPKRRYLLKGEGGYPVHDVVCGFCPSSQVGNKIVLRVNVVRPQGTQVYLVDCTIIGVTETSQGTDIQLYPTTRVVLTSVWEIIDMTIHGVPFFSGYEITLTSSRSGELPYEFIEDCPNVSMETAYVFQTPQQLRESGENQLFPSVGNIPVYLRYNSSSLVVAGVEIVNDDIFTFDDQSLELLADQMNQLSVPTTEFYYPELVVAGQPAEEEGPQGVMKTVLDQIKTRGNQATRDVFVEAMEDADIAARVLHTRDGKNTRERFYSPVSTDKLRRRRKRKANNLTQPRPRAVVQKSMRTKRLKKRNKRKAKLKRA